MSSKRMRLDVGAAREMNNFASWDGSVLDVGGKKNHGSVAPGTKPAPRWCPPGLSRTQKRRVQRLRTMEMTEKMEEEERDRWFNEDRPMVIPKKTWREKRLAREEKDDDNSSGSDKEESTEAQGDMDINMVFVLPNEFRAGEGDVAELTLGAERAVFEKTRAGADARWEFASAVYLELRARAFAEMVMLRVTAVCWCPHQTLMLHAVVITLVCHDHGGADRDLGWSRRMARRGDSVPRKGFVAVAVAAA
uniref:Uncharacterized protein n=1 Tax=Zea mays TaxID=4577 RepID=A0A804R3E7_MAIZE